ncbi:hypothetical protein C8J56DRAFT_1029984 [Mycena floridula]|nr:hypothetical protein C8J56DRAFT_1029984 [Mycena floridula]
MSSTAAKRWRLDTAGWMVNSETCQLKSEIYQLSGEAVHANRKKLQIEDITPTQSKYIGERRQWSMTTGAEGGRVGISLALRRHVCDSGTWVQMGLNVTMIFIHSIHAMARESIWLASMSKVM